MSLPSRLTDYSRRLGWMGSVVAVAVCMPVLYRSLGELPSVGIPESGRRASPGFSDRTAVAVVGSEWSSFLSGASGRPRSDLGGLGRRFRLVGTMVAYSSRLTDERKAVLDDRQKGLQRVVAEGESFDGVTVSRILRDRVVLRSGAHEETLMVRFEGDLPGGSSGATTGATTQVTGVGTNFGGNAEDRFGGRQIGENKRLFDRAAMLGYYSELMDNPDRLVKVFDSFKPVYGADRRVAGYRVNVEGESDFFRSVGPQEGDVVRSVNGMRMTSRRRAEFFIREYIDNRSNSFSFEVERGGQTISQTYESKP